MKTFRWIIGILAPYAFAIGITSMLSAFRAGHSGSFMYLAFLSFKEFALFFMVVFLSCMVIPAPKKYAALTSVLLNIAIILGIVVFVYVYNDPSKPPAKVMLVDWLSSFIGLAAGVAAVHFIFKNNGWDAQKTPGVETGEQY